MPYPLRAPQPARRLRDNYLRFMEQPEIRDFTDRGGVVCLACNGRPVEDLCALAELGHTTFGEKYVQEGLPKLKQLQARFPNVRRQYFGKLQTNKIKQVIQHFDHVESVASEREIDHLKKHLTSYAEETKRTFFMEVNIGQEPQKNGVLPANARHLLDYATEKGLPIDGLMGIPPKVLDPKPFFVSLRKLADQLHLPGCQMGFSRDYKEAIALGSTHIRIGTLVFDGTCA